MFILACRKDGRTLYLTDDGGLTANRAYARPFPTRGHAEWESQRRARNEKGRRTPRLLVLKVWG